MLKLCFNTIACRNAKEPLTGIVRQVAGLKQYNAIELWIPQIDSLDREQARELAAVCQGEGLEVPIVSSVLGVLRLEMNDREEQLELCRRLIRLAGWLGARYVRAFPGFVGEITSRNPEPIYYGWVVKAFGSFCRLLVEHGLTLVSETHIDTFVDTVAGALKFLGDVGEPNHGFILQLGAAPRWSGMDGVEFYRALAGHVRHMHLHPYPWEEDPDNLPNYARLLPVLEREAPGFYISVENCEGLVPPLEAARQGAELIRKLAAGEKVSAPKSA